MTEAEVFGDPQAMRALAKEIAGRAEIIAAVPAGFAAALDGAVFEGGAAQRLRGASQTARGGISAAVSELNGLAAALFSDAEVVEQMNTDAREQAEREADAHEGDNGGDPKPATAATPGEAPAA